MLTSGKWTRGAWASAGNGCIDEKGRKRLASFSDGRGWEILAKIAEINYDPGFERLLPFNELALATQA